MKKISTLLLILIAIISCKKENTSDISTRKEDNNVISTKKNPKIDTNLDECPILDSLDMLISEYKGIKFYTEKTMRGKGVLDISINNEIKIFNLDKTLFGSISISKNDNTYTIKLPNEIIAREVIPDLEYQIFNFDAEFPETNQNYLIVYINKEKKIIEKKLVKYTFYSWNEYIKSAFIENKYNSNKEDKNLYEVLKISNDSMQIKSVSKTSCEYVENYTEVIKWIVWKKDNCLQIKLNFCY